MKSIALVISGVVIVVLGMEMIANRIPPIVECELEGQKVECEHEGKRLATVRKEYLEMR